MTAATATAVLMAVAVTATVVLLTVAVTAGNSSSYYDVGKIFSDLRHVNLQLLL